VTILDNRLSVSVFSSVMTLFGHLQLVIINCVTGESRVSGAWPFIIGSGAADLIVSGPGVQELHCEVREDAKKFLIQSAAGAEFLLDGNMCTDAQLRKNDEHALVIGENLCLLKICKDPEKWLRGLEPGNWLLRLGSSLLTPEPVSSGEVSALFAGNDWSPDLQLEIKGARAGFDARTAKPAFDRIVQVAESNEIEEFEDALIASTGGLHTCPTCWLQFAKADVKCVSAHPEMLGDEKLGPGELKRFTATKFDREGRAVDPMGIPTSDLACPQCHHRLPPNFLELDQHIISIAGATSAGKSYFLTVLSHVLQRVLSESFDLTFMDADPTLNASLTDMRSKLFGGGTPEDALLEATQLEGDMYKSVLRHGREVKLPKPFLFDIVPDGRDKEPKSFVFYDNAGEHFQPGIDQTTRPGALHIASSSGIIFIFDPVSSSDFRRQAPQLEEALVGTVGVIDRQDTILAEMLNRLRRVKGLGVKDKLSTPLAFVVGKHDVWASLMGEEGFVSPLTSVNPGVLDLVAVESNSAAVRNLLRRTAPQMVKYAEAISDDVKYFPVSSFGHAPVPLAGGKVGPDPRKMNPFLVEIPMLWMLSRIVPGLVPTSEA
jgi:hypothetical protein